jgi:hypothetical protein
MTEAGHQFGISASLLRPGHVNGHMLRQLAVTSKQLAGGGSHLLCLLYGVSYKYLSLCSFSSSSSSSPSFQRFYSILGNKPNRQSFSPPHRRSTSFLFHSPRPCHSFYSFSFFPFLLHFFFLLHSLPLLFTGFNTHLSATPNDDENDAFAPKESVC